MATLINLINGKSAKCKINVPEYSACYASHDNLKQNQDNQKPKP